MSKYDYELKHIQQEYLAILKSFPPESDEDFYYHAVSLVDKCELFWMSKRLEMLEILSDLSAKRAMFFPFWCNLFGHIRQWSLCVWSDRREEYNQRSSSADEKLFY